MSTAFCLFIRFFQNKLCMLIRNNLEESTCGLTLSLSPSGRNPACVVRHTTIAFSPSTPRPFFPLQKPLPLNKRDFGNGACPRRIIDVQIWVAKLPPFRSSRGDEPAPILSTLSPSSKRCLVSSTTWHRTEDPQEPTSNESLELPRFGTRTNKTIYPLFII